MIMKCTDAKRATVYFDTNDLLLIGFPEEIALLQGKEPIQVFLRGGVSFLVPSSEAHRILTAVQKERQVQ